MTKLEKEYEELVMLIAEATSYPADMYFADEREAIQMMIDTAQRLKEKLDKKKKGNK